MSDAYRVPAPRPNWCVIEYGPGWAEPVLDNVLETEAKAYVARAGENDYGISYQAHCNNELI